MKTTILVDTGNLYYCINQRFPGARLDYITYLEEALGSSEVMVAAAYGTIACPATEKFAGLLRSQGWITAFYRPKKEFKRFEWGIGLACMAFRQLEYSDRYVLGVTAKEYTPLVHLLRRRKKEVHILSCGISKDLKEAATSWEEISEDFLCS